MLISTLAQYQSKVTKLIVPSFLKIVFVNIKAEICIALCHKTMDLQVIKSLIVTVYLVLLRKTKLFQFLVKISPYTLLRSDMTSGHTYHFVL